MSALGEIAKPSLVRTLTLRLVGAAILMMMLQAGLTIVAAKLLFILALLFFTGPAITHALAQAALHAGVKPWLTEDRRDRPMEPEKQTDIEERPLAPAAQ